MQRIRKSNDKLRINNKRTESVNLTSTAKTIYKQAVIALSVEYCCIWLKYEKDTLTQGSTKVQHFHPKSVTSCAPSCDVIVNLCKIRLSGEHIASYLVLERLFFEQVVII
jgi:hypothetical protein